MDGIEALRAMKEGKTVIRYRDKEQRASPQDICYVWDHKNTYDKEDFSRVIWYRFRHQKYWSVSDNPSTFWLNSDNFEI